MTKFELETDIIMRNA